MYTYNHASFNHLALGARHMLKKLVRYGNSNALVLDKAILELLNIEEGSIVKISTDGRSIILTPQQPATTQKITETITANDAVMTSVFKERMKTFKNLDPAQEQKILSLYQERATLAQQFYKQADLTELKEISASHNGDYTKYKAAHYALMHKLSPRLAQVSQAIEEIEVQHGLGDIFKKTFEFQLNTQAGMGKEFKDLFTKYAEQTTSLPNILNSPEYQHEAQLLTEKYHGNHSTEFLNELNKLRYKFDPKLEEMDKEMEAISKKYAQI